MQHSLLISHEDVGVTCPISGSWDALSTQMFVAGLSHPHATITLLDLHPVNDWIHVFKNPHAHMVAFAAKTSTITYVPKPWKNLLLTGSYYTINEQMRSRKQPENKAAWQCGKHQGHIGCPWPLGSWEGVRRLRAASFRWVLESSWAQWERRVVLALGQCLV